MFKSDGLVEVPFRVHRSGDDTAIGAWGGGLGDAGVDLLGRVLAPMPQEVEVATISGRTEGPLRSAGRLNKAILNDVFFRDKQDATGRKDGEHISKEHAASRAVTAFVAAASDIFDKVAAGAGDAHALKLLVQARALEFAAAMRAAYAETTAPAVVEPSEPAAGIYEPLPAVAPELWGDRPSDSTETIKEFVERVYGRYIARDANGVVTLGGMNQSDFFRFDKTGYRRLHSWCSYNGVEMQTILPRKRKDYEKVLADPKATRSEVEQAKAGLRFQKWRQKRKQEQGPV